ncbi:MAG: bifunctional phosphoribosyl-AMP cyclohydrolase/phosphoribosyl-ATP diphosphatase HisIE [Eubacterium sp.]|nr:bifunctional phosphoribosyl-AMP cyclohydrolase/phosphoribosyl-ATP diphosphatase HisIE [Eubacterium sp.]
MDGKVKIIPCVTLDNPVEEAKFYNDTGADAVAFFDSKASREGLEKNIPVIKEIAREVDIPIIACGGVRRLEDVKKLLYAGASKVCMKSAPLNDISIVKEASERFGSDRIIVTIDLTDCEDPVTYGKALKEAGAGELLLVHYGKLNRYNEYVKQVKKEVGLPIIVSSYSTEGPEIAELLNDTDAETISLYNLQQHDVMQLKLACKDAGVPVNLYESAVPFSEFKTDEKGLIPCIVQDYKTREVLMMAYMNEESFGKTLETGRMTYFSRSRNELWTKGETSGHFQYVKSLSIDCDRDTILAKVSQVGAACHTGNRSCFYTPLVEKEYNDTNPLTVFQDVYDVIMDRKKHPKEGSYTNYLFDKGIDKILKKVGEECTEVVIAAKNPDKDELKYEISDLLYHLMVLMAERDTTWTEVIRELAERR